MGERGIALTGCVEKKDMVNKLKDADRTSAGVAAESAKVGGAAGVASSLPASAGGVAETRFVELQGMVDRNSEDLHDDELYEDLLEDVRGECEKFGKVNGLSIPRPQRTEDGSGFLYGNRCACRALSLHTHPTADAFVCACLAQRTGQNLRRVRVGIGCGQGSGRAQWTPLRRQHRPCYVLVAKGLVVAGWST
jgi:hypothetical protein